MDPIDSNNHGSALARNLVLIALIVPASFLVGSVAPATAFAADAPADISVVPESCKTVRDWYDHLLETYPPGTAIPLIWHPTDAQLAEMGLPPADVLTARPYPVPTRVRDDGSMVEVPLDVLLPEDSGEAAPAVASYGGTGCLGIRPGALVLNFQDGGVAICSLAHVYGSPGSYSISTAGHCGGGGDTMTVVGLVGDGSGILDPVLLDFGSIKGSHDNGIGDDYALIPVRSEFQALVTPNMCFWGGPFFGAYEEEGVLVQGHYSNGKGASVSVDPNPFLAQGIVHYGHGLGIGAGGTPRSGASISWDPNWFSFVGAITPGDSGSGANTATSEAAGVITHIIVDPLLRYGVGVAAGTRASKIGTPATSIPVGLPAPVAGL